MPLFLIVLLLGLTSWQVAHSLSCDEAFERLKKGNEAFAQLETLVVPTGLEQREQLSQTQRPFALILACSDSRLPPELLFNQSVGDLFVIRVAGNVVDD